MFKTKAYHIILIAVFAAQINSCKNENCSKFTEIQIDNLISKGRLNDLFCNNDTLIMAFNMKGCIYNRFDIIKFFRAKEEIFIKAQINIHMDSLQIINCKTLKIKLGTNDSISFEKLLIELQQTKKDTSNHKSIFLSMGVKQKWERNYPYNRMSSDEPDYINMYLKVMHELYPNIKEFEPFIYIMEEQTL